jgi:anti-sigma regulatory factor (Ser/Thr protein kinase)
VSDRGVHDTGLLTGSDGEELTTEEALRRIHGLHRVTEAALAYLELEDLLRVLLDRTSEILETDTAAILLVEDDGASLAARAAKGLEEEVERGFRLPVGSGFAGRVAASRAPVVIEDLDNAPFEPVNPLFREKGVRALLGVPLIVERNLIGVLHVGTLSPRRWEPAEVELLQLVADRIALAIERDRLFERQKVATVFQRSVLPTVLPEVSGLSLASRYLPAATEAAVGGDWYDVIPFGSGVGLAIGDVVGHGVEAVALMSRLRTATRAFTIESASPAEIAVRLARFLNFEDPDSMATFIYCRLDPERGEVSMVNAGHPPPLVIRADGSCEYVEGDHGPPLGVGLPPIYRQVEFTLEPGSLLLLYTDGLVERRGARLTQRQDQLAAACVAGPWDPDAICTRVVEQMLPEEGPADDVALLAIHNVGLGPGPLEVVVPARPHVLGSVRRRLRAWLRQRGVSDRDIAAITLAASEACANSIEHAYGPDEATFELWAYRTDEAVEIEIRDSGHWREPRGKDRGRGLELMRTYMDTVDVRPGDDGTTVAMSKRLVDGER